MPNLSPKSPRAWSRGFFPLLFALACGLSGGLISQLDAAPAGDSIKALPDDPSCRPEDRRFITRTYELARSAVSHGNQPFGALLVHNGEIIFEYENTSLTSHDLTQHAELGLISKASQKFDAATLASSTLYASAEPCTMCCGAIRWSGIRRVVYGTTASQLEGVILALLPPATPATKPLPILECREVFARTEPAIKVGGPLLEEEGLAIQRQYWPNDPMIKAALPPQKK